MNVAFEFAYYLRQKNYIMVLYYAMGFIANRCEMLNKWKYMENIVMTKFKISKTIMLGFYRCLFSGLDFLYIHVLDTFEYVKQS